MTRVIVLTFVKVCRAVYGITAPMAVITLYYDLLIIFQTAYDLFSFLVGQRVFFEFFFVFHLYVLLSVELSFVCYDDVDFADYLGVEFRVDGVRAERFYRVGQNEFFLVDLDAVLR